MTQVLKAIDGQWLTVEVLYAVFANGELDGIEEGAANVIGHMQDLEDMECDNVKAFRIEARDPNTAWLIANDLEERGNKPTGRKWILRMKEEYPEANVTIVGLRGMQAQMRELMDAQNIQF
jgi:hypothetical protein